MLKRGIRPSFPLEIVPKVGIAHFICRILIQPVEVWCLLQLASYGGCVLSTDALVVCVQSRAVTVIVLVKSCFFLLNPSCSVLVLYRNGQ